MFLFFLKLKQNKYPSWKLESRPLSLTLQESTYIYRVTITSKVYSCSFEVESITYSKFEIDLSFKHL